MPNLTAICIGQPCQLTEVVYTRRMKKMDFRFFDERVERQVRNHAANITYLNIQMDGRREKDQSIRTFLKEVAPHLRQVKFFGQLWLPHDVVEALFQDFSTLQCLASTLIFLHIRTDYWPSAFWPRMLLSRIEAMFPKLRMILDQSLGALVRRDILEWFHWSDLGFDPSDFQILEGTFERALKEGPDVTSNVKENYIFRV
ncbi:hypothetical protein PIIN_06269 [Serendipita indica DSM 11827]|uniref:F-box domain-containing protein n=1 Tax=Serendipita indica (strain DSM 11827) TaxID=1109443 RepID=G4TLZ2_SERID|nr:hypothetical protein PIIN_06269 [Serendipita indica DSM 11827]